MVDLFDGKLNGQFTPPWPTRPVALQLIADPLSVPEPEPVTVMLLAQVAVNETLALDEVVGVTVYFTLPQPVGVVEALTDVQVPANASSETVGVVGDVGVVDESDEVSLFLPGSRSQPAADIERRRMTTAVRDFMILLIVAYDSVLYGLRGRLLHHPYRIQRFQRYRRGEPAADR